MSSGLIGRRKRNKNAVSMLTELRDYLNIESNHEILPTLKEIIGERDSTEKKLKGIIAEFGNKKIGHVRVIQHRDKYGRTAMNGVLYFNKKHIGKKVLIWEKKRRG